MIKAVPRHIAKRYNVIPILKDENGIKVAISDPSDLDTIDSLRQSRSVCRWKWRSRVLTTSNRRWAVITAAKDDTSAR